MDLIVKLFVYVFSVANLKDNNGKDFMFDLIDDSVAREAEFVEAF